MQDTPLPVQDLRVMYALAADAYLTFQKLTAHLAAAGLDHYSENAHSIGTRIYVLGSGIRGLLQEAGGAEVAPVVGASATAHTEADVPLLPRLQLVQNPQPKICALGHSYGHDQTACGKCTRMGVKPK